MLDIKVFAKSIQRLGEYYPKFELTKEQISTWYKYFQNYDYDQFMYIVQNYINTVSYPPQSPAHLRNGNAKHVEIPPKWLIKQKMNVKQIGCDENVDEKELKKLLESFKEEKE